MKKIPTELIQAIKNNNLVLFVGAGLSYDLINCNNQQIKGWSNLVLQLLDHLKNRGFEVDHLYPLLDKYEAIKILDLIETDEQLPKKEIVSFAKDYFFLSDRNNDFSLHSNLFDLSRKIVTTNYDNAFERSNENIGRSVAYKGRNYELTTYRNPESALLFKLHGCYSAGDSLVLFPSDYDDLYNNTDKDAEHSLLVLRNIIMNKSVLFVGTGMGDFQINNIFSEIKHIQGVYNQKHFIITRDSLDSSLNFLTPITIDDFSEITGIIAQLLAIKQQVRNQNSSNSSEREKEMKGVLKKLAELQKQASENMTANERKDKLLNEESLKYFSKGLALHVEGERENAIIKYKRVTELVPSNEAAFNNWGIALSELAKSEQNEALYTQSFEKFAEATRLQPNYESAFNNWGGALSELAELKEDDSLYEQSFEKYRHATEINPNYDVAFKNWGLVLAKFASRKKDKNIYLQSFDKFRISVTLNPENESAYNTWGNSISDLAEMEVNKKAAEKLFKESFVKYKKAIKINPGYYIVLKNWGLVLSKLADLKKDEGLFLQSFEKYKEAIELHPHYESAYNNWGSSLLALADLKKEDDLYDQSIDMYQKAIELGGSSYNLACLYAIRKDNTKALEHLKISLIKKDVKASYVKTDSDWKGFQADKDFLDLIEKFE